MTQSSNLPVNRRSCFSNRALVEATSEALNAFKNSVFEASKSFSTKAILLKHNYRLQGLLSGSGGR